MSADEDARAVHNDRLAEAELFAACGRGSDGVVVEP